MGMVALVTVATALAGCRRDTPPPRPMSDTPERIERRALELLLPPDTPAWLRVDVAALRAHAAFAPMWSGVDETRMDAMSRAVMSASELLVAIPDALFSGRVHVIRGPIDHTRLFDELRTDRNFAGHPFRVSEASGSKVWSTPDGTWSLSAPAANLLVTGDATTVREVVWRSNTPSEVRLSELPPVYGELRLSAVHRAYLRRALPRAELAELVTPIRTVRLRVEMDDGLQIRIEVDLAQGADVTSLRLLVGLLLAEVAAATWTPPAAREVALGAQLVISGPSTLPTLSIGFDVSDDVVAEIFVEIWGDADDGLERWMLLGHD